MIMKSLYTVEYGTVCRDNQVPQLAGAPIALNGTKAGRQGSIGLTDGLLSKNLMCIGGTGTGKTNAINTIISQVRENMTDQDVMMIFDTKGDFARTFYDARRGDAILGSSAEYSALTARWNIFNEVLADGWDENRVRANINEISRALFDSSKSESQPFFANAARDIFAAFMLAQIRCSADDGDFRNLMLNNEHLVSYFNNAGVADYKLLADSFPDFHAINMYLGDAQNPQALGVLAELLIMVRDMFTGPFGATGDFSIRDFIRSRGARTLFLEYDLSIGETLAPLYSLLLDLAFKEVLGRSTSQEHSGRVFVIIDELKLLPHLKHLDDAVNFGRSLGMRVISGLQGVSQIYDSYGEHRGKAIVTGFSSLFVFRPNDSATRDFAREHFGKNYLSEIFMVNQKPVSERRQGNVVEDWDMNSLDVGEAIVGLAGSPPFIFRFDEFTE